MADSEIVKLVQDQKRALLRKEAEYMRTMARRWLEVEHALEAEIYKTIADFGGEKLVTEAMILRNTHFQKLLYQARSEFSKYADYLDETVSDIQKKNLALGIDDAFVVLQTGMRDVGTVIAFGKLNISAIESFIGFSADGSPLRSLLMKSYGESVNGLLGELLTGLSKGLNSNVIAKNMADGFGVGLQRALTIARTEVMRSYRTGSLEQYRDSGVVQQYKRIATKDGKTCLGCLFADGQIYDSADEFSEHPNGRCQIIPVVRGAQVPTWETGSEWFKKQNSDMQLSILGQQRYDAWKNGTNLEDMSKHVDDSTWGGSYIPASLKDLGIGQ